MRPAALRPPPKPASPAPRIRSSCSANAALPKSPEWLFASDMASKRRFSTGSTPGSARKVYGFGQRCAAGGDHAFQAADAQVVDASNGGERLEGVDAARDEFPGSLATGDVADEDQRGLAVGRGGREGEQAGEGSAGASYGHPPIIAQPRQMDQSRVTAQT